MIDGETICTPIQTRSIVARLLLLEVVALCVLLLPSRPVWSGAAAPAAARQLALRLHVQGPYVVGDQAGGLGRPWTVWFPGHVPSHGEVAGVQQGWIPLRRGVALFVGPRGARGEFHYFDFSAVPHAGREATQGDEYHGPRLRQSQVLRVALSWLRRAGAPVPTGHLRIISTSGMTSIGGTGLCCFRFLYVVYWGGFLDRWGFIRNAKGAIYIADAGEVVQADTSRSLDTNRQQFSRPCSGNEPRDRNGVSIGSWCFNYASAVHDLIIAAIGNHSPWVDNPAYIAALFTPSARIEASAIQRISLSPQRAVYRASYGGESYRLTLVPAFPGLVKSVWELVDVKPFEGP